MNAQIQLSGGDEISGILDLWEWLRGERGLAGAVQAIRQPPGDRELGGVVEMLAVALGSGGAGAVLARSLTAWLQTRRPDVTVTVKTQAGTVSVETRNLDRDQVLPVLERVLGGGDV